jgi:hypothetical protein
VVVGVEQHLVGLLRVGPENEGAAVGELEVRDLQFGPLAVDVSGGAILPTYDI